MEDMKVIFYEKRSMNGFDATIWTAKDKDGNIALFLSLKRGKRTIGRGMLTDSCIPCEEAINEIYSLTTLGFTKYPPIHVF